MFGTQQQKTKNMRRVNPTAMPAYAGPLILGLLVTVDILFSIAVSALKCVTERKRTFFGVGDADEFLTVKNNASSANFSVHLGSILGYDEANLVSVPMERLQERFEIYVRSARGHINTSLCNRSID